MRQSTLNSLLLAILAAATAAIAVDTLSTGGPPGFITRLTRSHVVRNWESLTDSSTVVTAGDGSVTIIEFSDFQCAFCARAQTVLHELVEKYPGKVTILFRHFPLPGHKHAVAAAMAAECAAEQGLFRDFQQLLFEKQDSLGSIPWDELAAAVSVPDPEDYSECVRTERYRHRVERDRALAQELAIPGTPGFIVNGRRLQGAKPIEEFERLFR